MIILRIVKILNKIGLYFMAVVILLVTASQGFLFVFEHELNNAENGLFGVLEVVTKYKALDNIWFAMSSQVITVVLFTIIFVFIIKELLNKRKKL